MVQNVQHLWQPHGHANKKIWQLAWPMILANITVPLLGFVDTAVIGHLNSSDYLSGTALGSLVITISFWLLGFLRMSTTALASQAYGRRDTMELTRTLMQGLALALFLAIVILSLQSWLFEFMLMLVVENQQMDASLTFAQQYFNIRIWIAPVSLANLVFMGYLIGIGQTRPVLVAVVMCNIINVIADLLFVPILGLNVEGVAYASIIAECSQLLILIFYNRKALRLIRPLHMGSYSGSMRLLSMNRVLFVRSALLQLCISFLTIYASRFGPNAVAINAIVMQFFLFLSFALDGVAFGLEALVGQKYGSGRHNQVRLLIYKGLRFGLKFALFYTLIYSLLATEIIHMLTNITELQTALERYYWLIIILPIGSFMCFIFDGIFVGLGWVKQMRNSMFVAALVFFVAVVINQWFNGQNIGLWCAFWLFLFTRGASQFWMINNHYKNRKVG